MPSKNLKEYVLAFSQEFFSGGGGGIYRYANFFVMLIFFIAFGQNVKGGKSL